MNVLIVPCFNRPDSTLRCLRSIASCDLSNTRVVVSEDGRQDRRRPEAIAAKLLEIIDEAREFLKFEHVVRRDCVNTWDNIHRSLLEVNDSEFIYFMEDDFLVEPGFISWHQQAQKEFQPFISCADTVLVSYRNQNPAEVVVSHSYCTIRAGCMRHENLKEILTRPWNRHFEEVAQNYLIQNKLLAVFPTMPRAHDTGAAGVNQAAMERTVEFQNPPTPEELLIGVDLRNRWDAHYAAQTTYGF